MSSPSNLLSPFDVWQRLPFVATDGLIRCVLVASRALRPRRKPDGGAAEIMAGPVIVRGELGLAVYADGRYWIGHTAYKPIDAGTTPGGLLAVLETQRRADLRDTLLNPVWLASRRPGSATSGDSSCPAI